MTTHFVENKQTEQDYKILEKKAKDFQKFLKENIKDGYSGFLMMTTKNIDSYVHSIGITNYGDFIYLIVMLISTVSLNSGKSHLEIWKDIFSQVQGDIDGSFAKKSWNAFHLEKKEENTIKINE